MSARPEGKPPDETRRLEVAVDQAIAACGGDTRGTIRVLILANEYLEAEVKELQAAVSNGYGRGKLRDALPRDRKDWYD